MGKLTEHIAGMIKRQIKEKGIVVWYDPEKIYTGLAQDLNLPETAVLHYQDSFFRLRRQMDEYIEFLNQDDRPVENCGIPPALVLYVPLDRNSSRNALIECESAGAVMEPGASVIERNTRLRVVAETVFMKIAPDQVDHISKQIDAGNLTLDELDHMAEELASISSSVIKLIFKTSSPEEVILLFAATNKYDDGLISKNAAPEIAALIKKSIGIDLEETQDPVSLRQEFVRKLLLSDFLAGVLPSKIPAAFSSIQIPENPVQVETIKNICRTWRNRADLRDAYVDAAANVVKETGLEQHDLFALADVYKISDLETFPLVDERLIAHAEELLLKNDGKAALSLAEKRIHSFWPIQTPRFQLKWTIVRHAAHILMQSTDIRGHLKKMDLDPGTVIGRYVDGDHSWCSLDTEYRRMEHHFALLDLEPGPADENMQRMIAHVRSAYTSALEVESEIFTASLVKSDFEIKGWGTQDAVYDAFIAPSLKEGQKIAYILVDALRFEMGRELSQGLNQDFEIELTPVICQLPSLTSIGMTALLPDAGKGLTLKKTSSGKMVVELGSAPMKNRADRIKHLQSFSDKAPVCCKLNQILKPTKKLKDEIETAPWLVVTSQELDRWAEEGEGEEEVRIFMEEVLDRLSRGIRRLAAMGIEKIVVAADHGHLFGETIEGGMKMDPPGGDTVELHSRAWIGKGGVAGDGYFRITADQVGLGGDLELAFPRGIACFKTKSGSRAYCHGGASLQEIMIPVLRLTQKKPKDSYASASVIIEMAGAKVTNRFFSITAFYKEKGLFAGTDLRVKVVIKSGRKEIGYPVMAAGGFDAATREIQLKKNEPNPITIMLAAEEEIQNISIHIMDAISGIELGRLKDIPVDIAI